MCGSRIRAQKSKKYTWTMCSPIRLIDTGAITAAVGSYSFGHGLANGSEHGHAAGPAGWLSGNGLVARCDVAQSLSPPELSHISFNIRQVLPCGFGPHQALRCGSKALCARQVLSLAHGAPTREARIGARGLADDMLLGASSVIVKKEKLVLGKIPIDPIYIYIYQSPAILDLLFH